MVARALVTSVVGLAAGCGTGGVTQPGAGDASDPWRNLVPVANSDPDALPQPRRGHPFAIAVTPAGRALVTLRGSEADPGREVVGVDLRTRRVTGAVRVGDRPVAIAVHPDGDLAVVLSSYSPYAAVVHGERLLVTATLEVGYYAEGLVFSADGGTLFVTSRATDELLALAIARDGDALRASGTRAAPAGVNPSAVALAPDGGKVYVAEQGGLGVRVYDAATLTELAFISLNAPVFDLEVVAGHVLATTLNDTNGLPCEADADFPGEQGDGVFDQITDRTCSRGFADIQNELAFIDPATDEVVVRYTSDSAEISENDREGDHPPELMKVVGALPHSIAVAGPTRVYVTMGASFELVEIDVALADGVPGLAVARVWNTGFAPRGVAVTPDGKLAAAANMLGETVSVFDLDTGDRWDVAVGETSPPFPATSAELGELFFFTSKYATDGDQSCAHCHPDAESDGKAWGVEVVRAFGRRSTIPTRNLHATRPLLIEGVFDENDFSLEVEGISFRPDFHDSSYALQVQRRDAFYRAVSLELFGREVGFDAMIRHLGAFLIVEPRLLPNPFDADTPQVARGRALYFRFDVACASCHPSPAFASPESFSGITTMARFDRPRRSFDPDVSLKFLENARDGFFNANTLRGLWDRRGALLHDGRARTVREVLLTPGHPCLEDGERAFNERDGEPDTHGGISHLSCEELDDLVAFLLTIQ